MKRHKEADASASPTFSDRMVMTLEKNVGLLCDFFFSQKRPSCPTKGFETTEMKCCQKPWLSIDCHKPIVVLLTRRVSLLHQFPHKKKLPTPSFAQP